MNKTLLITSLAWLSASTTVFAGGLALYSVLPNTVDDTNLEYIEVQNTSCAPISLGGYTLRDAAGSIFTLSNETLSPGAIRRFIRAETHIALNNTDETLELLSINGESINTRSYATSVKWVGINFVVNPYEDCTTETITQVVTITTTGSWVLSQTGDTMSGATNMSSWSGSLSQTGSIQTGSLTGSWSWGITGTGIIGSFSGVTVQTGSLASIPVSNSPLLPLLLRITDLDRNGRVDRLSVEYSGTLSGVLKPEKLIIYSNTGGLSSTRIESGSGIIRALTFSGAELLIDLHEQDLVHTDLRINPTTESHIRLKTLTDFGLTDLGGLPVQALTLTESFQRYASAYIRNEAYIPVVTPTSSPTVYLTVNPSSIGQNTSAGIQSPTVIAPFAPPSIIPMPTQNIAPSSVSLVPTTSEIPRALPKITIQSGTLSDGSCRTSVCAINLIANNTQPGDVCEWWVRPNIGANIQIRGCNPRAIRLGANGGVVTLSVLGLSLNPEQMSLAIQAYIPRITPNQKTKSVVLSKNAGNSSSQKPKTPLKEAETTDIFEEYFEIMDGDGNISLASNEQEIIPKKVSASKSPKNSTKLSAQATSKSAKKASTTQPTTVKTTKTTKTTKVSKPPTLPKSAEKPQKNPVPSTSASITPTAIGIVWLLCSALGFGVAIYRRRDS